MSPLNQPKHASASPPPEIQAAWPRRCRQPLTGLHLVARAKTVTNAPATTPLTAYAVEFEAPDTLAITLPDHSFAMDAQVVAAGATTPARVRVDFRAERATTYEVLFRATHNDAWVAITFATTPTGAVTQTVFTGQGRETSLYVDRTRESGFYAVSMKLRSV